MKKILFAGFSTMAISANAFAQAQVFNGADIINKHQENDTTLLWLTVAVVLLMLVVILLTIDIRRLSHKLAGVKQPEAKTVKRTWWHLFRMKVPKDHLEEGHTYDGIQEYDNNPPSWFNWLFYGTIAFAVVYLMYFHVLKIGPLQDEEYAQQMKEAEVVLAKAQEKAIELSEKPPFTDEANLEMGKTVYLTNCGACHGPEGQGGIGPNLTDEYWIHGGSYKDVFKTIFNGVPEKGMLSWKKSLRPDEIRAVSSFVHKMRGTNPANPKEPQGEKYVGEATAELNN